MIKLKTDPYPVDIWFTTCEREFINKRNKIVPDFNFITDMSDIDGCCSSNSNNSKMVVGLFNMSSGVLVHELSHAAINVFEYVHMPINGDTTEAFAYYLESLYKQCSNYLAKQVIYE